MTLRMAIVVASVALAVPATASAQSRFHFTANLSGGQAVPPSGSAATGSIIVTLFVASPSGIAINGSFSGLGSSQISAHIHGPGAPGVNGPILFTLTTSGTTSGAFSNSFPGLTPVQEAQLRAGLWYVDVHSTGFPGGEIRGQLIAQSAFVASQTGAQVVPPVSSGATGFGYAILNPAQTFVNISAGYNNLPGGHIGFHIHGPAVPGASGPIIYTIAPSAPNTQLGYLHFGTALTPTQVAQLRAGLLYFDLHSAANPDGEIRGQIKLANKPVDLDGDSRAEIGVFRPGTGVWYAQNPATGAFSAQQFGVSTDSVVPGDYDGDGKTDVAVWRPSTGTWYVTQSSDGAFVARQFGTNGDTPLPFDYDGDGRVDFAVFRSGAQGYFYILQSLDGSLRSVPFGTTGDAGLFGDYDGDRKNDIAVYRTSTGTYYVQRSSDDAVYAQQFGVFSTDWISPSDYDGDGKADFASFRFAGATPGVWYILQTSTGTLRVDSFGAGTDRSQPVDFDGDGLTDLAVTRPGGGVYTWYVWQSSTSSLLALVFGLSTDVQLSRYLTR